MKHLRFSALSFLGLLSLLGFFSLSSCMFWDIPPIPDPPAGEIVQDTCMADTLYLLPEFITGTFEITEDLATSREFTIGPYTVWIHPDNQDDMPTLLDSLFELYHPEYDYTVYVYDMDSRILSVIVDGPDSKVEFQGHVYCRYNGVKHYFGWVRQGYIYGGALSEAEYAASIQDYPSVDWFNFRNTKWDSTDYVKAALEILGHCKVGRTWADFRFNPYPMTDSVLTLFDQAGWNQVLSTGSGIPEETARIYNSDDWGCVYEVSNGEQIIILSELGPLGPL